MNFIQRKVIFHLGLLQGFQRVGGIQKLMYTYLPRPFSLLYEWLYAPSNT
jgi:hypothetical protein